jgi:hypothetical protein
MKPIDVTCGSRPSQSLFERDPLADASGVLIGQLLAIDEGGNGPMIRYEGQLGVAAKRARSAVDLRAEHIGHSVVLTFEGRDPDRPVVIGVVRSNLSGSPTQGVTLQVDVDGERMVVCAARQLVLRCGKASITLTSAGKVLIDGSYVLTRSTGVNRIKGGSVQLN